MGESITTSPMNRFRYRRSKQADPANWSSNGTRTLSFLDEGMTELIWEGKYDAQRRKIAQSRIALPFQTVETVNESAVDRQRNQELFATNRPTDWRNRLIWGDKKYVLPSLLEEFGGKVNLIYIDPPFDTGANFAYIATIPDDPETEGDQGATFTKEPSVIEQKAYRD